jgi:beta-galactosidase
MLFGAALPADTLDDLDILHQMALRMDCRPLFKLSEWADTRVSRGPDGSFLFINNYQDDPLSTTVTYDGQTLFGGSLVSLPARRGLILPLEWRLDDNVTVHYATAEVTAVTAAAGSLTLTLAPAEFTAELSFAGYECDQATIIADSDGRRRVRLSGQDGRIALRQGG